jgi:hypothetical protein
VKAGCRTMKATAGRTAGPARSACTQHRNMKRPQDYES